MTKTRKLAFKNQQRLSTYQLILDIPNSILSVIASLMSGSLMVMLDTVDTIASAIQSLLTVALSKRLMNYNKYEYNYGMGKVEALGALASYLMLYSGLIAIFFGSVFSLLNPSKPKAAILFAIILKIVTTTVDFFIYISQRRLYKKERSKIIASTLALSQKNLVVDLITLFVITLAFFLRANILVSYFESIVCIVLSAYLIVSNWGDVKSAIDDVLDKPVDEESQLLILKTASGCIDRNCSLSNYKTRKSGNTLFVDLELDFDEKATYSEVQKICASVEGSILADLPDAEVNFVISGY